MNKEKTEDRKISCQINKIHTVSHWDTLVDYVNEHKPYRDENCSIRSLSEQMKIPEHQLSKTLNSHRGISFSQFINEFRIKDAVIMLQDQSKNRKTVEIIAIDCGFGSRSSFYRAFYKIHAMSPKDYRKLFPKDGHM